MINDLDMTTERTELIGMISDTYKDLHGFRPRTVYDFDSMSIQDLEAELDSLSDELSKDMEAERVWREEKVVEFKQRVQSVINMGAGDEDTAIRWMFDLTDGDYFEFEGILYREGIMFTEYGESLKKRAMALLSEN